jgi:hypothetical protein
LHPRPHDTPRHIAHAVRGRQQQPRLPAPEVLDRRERDRLGSELRELGQLIAGHQIQPAGAKGRPCSPQELPDRSDIAAIEPLELAA